MVGQALTAQRLYESLRFLNEEAFRPRKMGRGKPLSLRSDFPSPWLYGDSYHKYIAEPEWELFQ